MLESGPLLVGLVLCQCVLSRPTAVNKRPARIVWDRRNLSGYCRVYGSGQAAWSLTPLAAAGEAGTRLSLRVTAARET